VRRIGRRARALVRDARERSDRSARSHTSYFISSKAYLYYEYVSINTVYPLHPRRVRTGAHDRIEAGGAAGWDG